MRTGPASSAFTNIVAITAINGQRNERGHAQQQQGRHKLPGPSADRRANALHEGATVAPGQLLFVQSAGQAQPTQTHRQGVAVYPSLPSDYQVVSSTGSLSRLHTPAPGTTLFDFEI